MNSQTVVNLFLFWFNYLFQQSAVNHLMMAVNKWESNVVIEAADKMANNVQQLIVYARY